MKKPFTQRRKYRERVFTAIWLEFRQNVLLNLKLLRAFAQEKDSKFSNFAKRATLIQLSII